jgi:predicted nucleic acid-binding protein
VTTGYLLDTNVVSESRKARPNHGVITFLSNTDGDSLFLSVLTLGELRKGVAAKRRTDSVAADRFESWVDDTEMKFARRILKVDAATARLWGELSAGRSVPPVDTLIAATAIVHGLILVTRNTRDVELTGVATLNPWDPQ